MLYIPSALYTITERKRKKSCHELASDSELMPMSGARALHE